MTHQFGATATADEFRTGVDLTGENFLLASVLSGTGRGTVNSPNPFADGVRPYAIDSARAAQLRTQSEASPLIPAEATQ